MALLIASILRGAASVRSIEPYGVGAQYATVRSVLGLVTYAGSETHEVDRGVGSAGHYPFTRLVDQHRLRDYDDFVAYMLTL